jgi:P pilus assembly chaperone PapD
MRKKLFWLICLMAFLSPLSAWAAPQAVIEETRIILDKSALEGEQVKGTFAVVNKGDEDLLVLKIVPG